MADSTYNRNIFVNCPFDEEYSDMFPAIVFTIHDCGYNARCALETSGSETTRIEKLYAIIKDSCYGVHDISRVELNSRKLPRFNMPLELGIFLGARQFGSSKDKTKKCLILDKTRYRYQQFCSDLAGNDPKAHNNSVSKAVNVLRDWIRDLQPHSTLPCGKEVYRRYKYFRQDLPIMCSEYQLDHSDLCFNDLKLLITAWVETAS